MLDLSPASACGKSEMLEALVHLWLRVASQFSTEMDNFPVQNLPGVEGVHDL